MNVVMTIRTHILDLRERRAAYAHLIQTMLSGKLMSGQGEANAARIADLRGKIAALDLLIAAEEANYVQGPK
jgi:hypothetical protein